MEKKTKNKRFLKSSRRATKSMVKVGKKSVKAKVTKRGLYCGCGLFYKGAEKGIADI